MTHNAQDRESYSDDQDRESYRAESEPIQTIADVPADFALLANEQDICAVMDYLGKRNQRHSARLLFVRLADGDYTDVLACGYSVPLLTHRVYRLL